MTAAAGQGRFRGKRALVTGGAGFIGSTLAIRLVEEGAEVTIADAMLPEYGGNLFNLEPVRDQVRINYCDVRDEHLMALMVEGMDYVFHLAAQVSHVKSLSDPYPDIDINIKGTVALMEAVRKVNPRAVVVRSGTRGEYGAAAKLPVSEEAPTHPRGLYEISLLTSEKILLMYHEVHGIPVVHLRVTNTYGPRAQMKSPHYGVANWLIRLALDGRPIIGPISDVAGLWVCAGHGPWGISTGPGSSRLVVSQMLGLGEAGQPPEFSPARFAHDPA